MCLSSCPPPSIFLAIFRIIAWFNRRHNDASGTGRPMIMQWIVEALNECTNWELEYEPKTLIMAGWIYRWGQQHGIQQWNGHLISGVFVCWRRGVRDSFIVNAHWPRPESWLSEGALTSLVHAACSACFGMCVLHVHAYAHMYQKQICMVHVCVWACWVDQGAMQKIGSAWSSLLK